MSETTGEENMPDIESEHALRQASSVSHDLKHLLLIYLPHVDISDNKFRV